MADEPDNLVLQILREMRAKMEDMAEKMATKDDLAAEMHSLRADVASDLHSMDAKIDGTRKELSNQIASLRREVALYHSSVAGHGMLISELDTRMRRVEQHLNLPPWPLPDAH